MHRRNREREGNLKLECGAHCIGANIVILIWQWSLWEGDQEVVKRSGRDEPMWVAIHKYMEAKLGISLYSYFYLKIAKPLCFSYYLLCFSSTKLENIVQKWWGLGSGGKVAQIMCTHINKCQKDKIKKEQMKNVWLCVSY
jgi:hypothetical protein